MNQNYYLKFTKIQNDSYFWFKNKNEIENIGKCIFNLEKDNKVFIKYIEISKNFRGENLFEVFWHLLEEGFKQINVNYIYLNAEELQIKYNKLVNLYKKLGFYIDDKIPIIEKYNGDELVRIVRMFKKI